MADLKIVLLYESNNNNNKIINDAKNTDGISVIDFKNDNELYSKYIHKVSKNGTFFISYNGKTKPYEVNYDNLLKIKNMLTVFQTKSNY